MAATITFIILLCNCVTGVAAVAALVVSISKKARMPAAEQDRRITVLETEVEDIRAEIKSEAKETKVKLDKDMRRLNHMEQGSEVTCKALLALLRHGIDGNDTDAMKQARDELDEYLVGHEKWAL